jgi:hypothetical protein
MMALTDGPADRLHERRDASVDTLAPGGLDSRIAPSVMVHINHLE